MSDIQQSNASTTPQTGLTETDLKHHSQELGYVGKIFGSKEQAPMNRAGLVILICLLGIIAAPYLPERPTFSEGDLIKLLSSIALAALTFLGGYLGGKKIG